ncbi:hypothetical protein [Massilia sp. NP310]|uniref:hypothetical protein n=1 Tax=Massilia sp. NP310 TaxID=2861282 RepID=UPI001C63537F|nr:hypothetical protein [Massilia sp. NP310]QYG01869.1 hypothetical protein KY496_26875 [Massilia sp. NP310]
MADAKKVEARVLIDCVHGKCNDVIVIDQTEVKSLEGVVDAEPAAVAYAKSLAGAK